MRMLSTLSGLALLAVLAGPALAIEPGEAPEIYDNADLSEEADIALWCGAAFQIAFEQTKATDAAASQEFASKANTLLTRAGGLMVVEGVAQDDIGPVSEAYTYHVADQIMGTGNESDYTLDECNAEYDARK